MATKSTNFHKKVKVWNSSTAILSSLENITSSISDERNLRIFKARINNQVVEAKIQKQAGRFFQNVQNQLFQLIYFSDMYDWDVENLVKQYPYDSEHTTLIRTFQ
jgi:hypothetical protein